ncbi:kinesin light chain 1 [Polyplosphaeria fusca]|uniref:Kinesin light chain 1 n=1 Tax=Polyplosphaeria fusca TaxID=682080 RepID=A0A9P4UZI0_9PLEO|nr:kinesin light chain 1 [Polyplosphaeria fusca]
MRLLVLNGTGEISLTEEWLREIPRYAILSHTWRAASEEVNFKDMTDGSGIKKPSYDKIRFCGERAKRDGLRYFWVDTCCIDKSNSTELSEAINSMFRWYQNAAKCYVYLADVSKPALNASDRSSQMSWKTDFEKSRWFTRGWTLQELIAPASVEFFSKEGVLLGNKQSLGRWTSDITGIPVQALHGRHLATFSIAERLSWQEYRDTTREEDKAYSLLGICDVHIPLIYGEGRSHAFKRLREEIEKELKGANRDDFSVAFSLSDVSDIEHFVAREEELEEMRKALSSDGSRQTVVLHGLGGIGKTQLTVAYAKRHRNSYSAIFWLNVNDEDLVKQSFAKMARQILREHPTAARVSSVDLSKGLDDVVDAVKSWLSLPNNTRWLAIYDNYDNPKLPGRNTDSTAVDIRMFLPESYQGSVIVTTRSSQVKIGHRIKVGKLEGLQNGLRILSHASSRELANDPDAVKLAKELDGLPLALATAGAYLHQVTMSLSEYLRLYKESWLRLQTTSPDLSSYEDRTLYSTWQISYDRVEQQNRLSAMLLRLWAYFDNYDLWFELLQHSDVEDPEWVQELTKDELTFHAAVRVLADHGLIEADQPWQAQVESRGYSMHSCVHAWSIHVLNQEWDQGLARMCVKFVGSHVPGQENGKWWLTQRRLLHHALRCSYMVLHNDSKENGMEWVWHQLGVLYANQGKLLVEAEKMYQRALQGYEKALGSDIVTSYLPALNAAYNLGLLYTGQGNTNEARRMYTRALSGYQIVFGPDHDDCKDVEEKLGALQDSHSAISSDRSSSAALVVSPVTPSTNTSALRISRRRRVLYKLGWK